jgi:hypothetical protein
LVLKSRRISSSSLLLLLLVGFCFIRVTLPAKSPELPGMESITSLQVPEKWLLKAESGFSFNSPKTKVEFMK